MSRYLVDTIICTGGGRNPQLTELSKMRLDLSLLLLNNGVAKSIVALGERKSTYLPGAAEFNDFGCDIRAEYLIQQGVDNSKIIRIPRGIDTIGEAFAVRNYCLANSLNELALVTSSNHMARTLWLFERIFQNNAKFIIYPLSDGNKVSLEEEIEYLKMYQNYFEKKFKNNWIEEPEPFDKWYIENQDLYLDAAKIRESFRKSGNGTQDAYVSAPNEK